MLSRSDLMHEGVDAAITLGSAGAMGLIHGRAGEMKKFGPIPADAAIGVGAAVIGISGLLGRRGAGYAFSVAKGTLSYFTGSIFAQVGQRMRKSAGESVSISTDRTVMKGLPQGAAPAFPPAAEQFSPAELVRRVTGKRAL